MSSSSDDDYYDLEEREKALHISNDLYYEPKTNYKTRLQRLQNLDIPEYGSDTIKHTLPAYDLWLPFFPSYISEEKFHNFHRPKLRNYNTGPQAKKSKQAKGFPIRNLTTTLYRFQKKLRYRVISAINERQTREEIIDKHLLLRRAKDLTAKKGELFLFEYSEEYPPVLSQIGMSSNVKIIKCIEGPIVNKCLNPKLKSAAPSPTQTALDTKIKQVTGVAPETNNNTSNKNYPIGFEQIVNINTTRQLYYNHMKPGSRIQVIENNLYRAPIYEHEVPSCDFLIIRTRNNFYIRSVKTIFTVGQTMPLITIPRPLEKSIQKFRADLSNIYIHKLFKESKARPPVIDVGYLMKLFPDYHSKIIKKRLTSKGVKSKYKRGSRQLYEVGLSKYGSISILEMRRQFTPELYCVNMAMLAARQRLRELNYSESMIDPSDSVEREVEVLAAPWNTSLAVSQALNGKIYLDLKKHLVDPTGPQREGFSCVKWSRSPTEEAQILEQKEKLQTRFDPSKPIPLTNPFLQTIKKEKLERLAIYQKEAQMIAEVQSSVLSSKEVLSSDDESANDSADEKEDALNKSFDEQLHDLDRLVLDNRTEKELNYEKEEEIRQQMLKEFTNSDRLNGKQETNINLQRDRDQYNVAAFNKKILKILRTYKTEEGMIQRTEIVRDPKIIALYVKQKKAIMSKSCPPVDIRDIENAIINNNSINGYGDHTDVSMSDMSEGCKSRRSSISLGPSELCRADGTILTISKSVLDLRSMRNSRRQYRKKMIKS